MRMTVLTVFALVVIVGVHSAMDEVPTNSCKYNIQDVPQNNDVLSKVLTRRT